MHRVAEATGVAVIDANQLTVGVDDYADPHHLNGRGAEKLSAWVAEQLQQHPDLQGGR